MAPGRRTLSQSRLFRWRLTPTTAKLVLHRLGFPNLLAAVAVDCFAEIVAVVDHFDGIVAVAADNFAAADCFVGIVAVAADAVVVGLLVQHRLVLILLLHRLPLLPYLFSHFHD